MKFGYNRPSSFRGGHLKLWTDRRTTEPAYNMSSPGAFGSGELIRQTEEEVGRQYQRVDRN